MATVPVRIRLRTSARITPGRVVGWFTLAGLLWIWLTDRALVWTGLQDDIGFLASAGKGSIFVLLSAAFLYWLVRREMRAIADAGALLRAVVDSTTDAVFAKDAAGRYLVFNEAAARFVGKPAADVVGHDDTFLFDPFGAELVMERDRRVLATGREETEEETITAGGVTRTYLAIKAPLRDAAGRAIGTIGFSRDITDRKQAEEEARAGERRFRELADAIPQIVWTAGPDGAITHVNAQTTAYTGVGGNGFLGWSWEQVVHPDDLPGTVAHWKAVLQTGAPQEFEFRIRRTDGEYRRHLNRQVPTRDADGVVTGWYGTCTDIEEIRRAETELRESESRLRLALSAAKLGAWDWDFRTGRVHRSDECRAILGVAVLDTDAATFERSLHPDDAGSVMDALRHAAADGERFAAEFRVVHPDGRVRWVSDEGRCQRDQTGSPVRMIGVMRDITDRVQAEENLRRSVSMLQATLDATADGILVVDMDGRIVDLNRQFVDLWHLPPEFAAVGRKEDLVAAFRTDGAMAAVFGQLADPHGFADRVAEIYRTPEKPSFDVVTFRDGRILERYSQPQVVHGAPVGRVWSFRDVTDRVRAEEALRESEGRLRLALEAARMGVWEWEIATDVVYWSPECAAVTGHPATATTLADFTSIVHPDDVDRVMAASRHAVETRETFAAEFRAVQPDGGTRWLSNLARAEYAADGRPLRMVGTVQDVTARVRAEAALRESEARLRAYLDHALDAFFVHDESGRVVDVNRQACESLGRSREELIGTTPLDFDPDVTPEQVAAILAETTSGGVVTFETRHLRRDGTSFPVEIRVRAFDSGGDRRALAFVRDLTHRKRAEAELRESEERFRNVFEHAATGIAVADHTGQFVRCNPAFCRLVGYTEDELRAVDFSSLVHPEDRAANLAANLRVRDGESPSVEVENRYVHRCGEPVFVHKFITLLPAPAGRPPHLMALVTNVTERRRAEEAVRESEGRLRLFVEHAPVGVAMLDRDLRYLSYSRRWLTDYQLEGRDLHGRCHYDIFPDIPERWKEIHRRCLTGASERCEQDRFDRSDGGAIYLRWEIQPWFEADGRVGGVVFFTEVITDRVEAEVALRESERLLALVTGAARVGLVVVDEGFVYRFANDAYARIVGPATADIVGKRVPDVLPHEWDQIRPRLDRALAGERVEFELALSPREGGEPRRVRAMYEPRQDAEGRPTVVVVVADVTEIRRAESALRASEERFRALVENGYEGINILNADGWSVYSSPRNAALVGLAPGEVDDDTLGFVHPDDRGRAQSAIAEIATEAGRGIELRLRLLRKDGSSFWVEAHARNLFEHAAVRGIVVNWRDISDRVRAEAALERRQRLLERIASGRVELAELLAQIAELVEDEIGDSLCSILLLDGNGRLRIGVARHLPPEYNAAIDGIAIGPAVGSCGTAAHLGRPVIVADIAADPLWADYRAAALPHGLRACWSVPICAAHATGNGSVLGTFALYRKRSSEPTADEMAVLHAAAQLAGIAIERVRAEAALRESEERFRRLVEVLPVAVHVVDGGRLTYCNPACVQLFGAASEADLIGRSPFELLHPDYHARVAAELVGLHEPTARTPLLTVKVVRLDGQTRMVLGVATPVRREHSNAHLVCLNDITEQERSTALLRSVLGSVADAILTIDAAGTVKSANPAAVRASGYAEGEIVGRNVRQLMPEPYRGEHDDYIANYLRTGMAKVIGIGREVEARRKDGTTFPVELTVTEFEFDGARHFTGVLRDISVRRRLEAQLRQAQKMEAIGRLAGGVAHDFNNLLTVINGYCDLLLMGLPHGDPNRASVAAVLDAGERAARLTQQLLAFSRKAVVEPKVLDLNELVTQAGRLLRSLIGEDIILAVVTDPALGPVKADPGQLEQVILNLAVNARDAMPTGGRLTIETRNVTLGPADLAAPNRRPGRYACLRVTDSGCGMTDAVKANIFEPFFTTKGVGKGTGLGLAVVHGVVEGCDGLIEVESAVGVGTTFAVSLPTVEAAGGTTGGASPVAVTGGHETILLVEDEDAVRTIARLALEMHGYTVLEADGGADAVRLAGTHPGPIDLLVSDVVMPEMGGRQLLETLRGTRPALRVLFMSGYTDDAVLLHGVVESRDSFIQKPFTPLALARKVRAVIDAGKAGVGR